MRAGVITLISTGTIKFYELLNRPQAPLTYTRERLRWPIKEKWVTQDSPPTRLCSINTTSSRPCCTGSFQGSPVDWPGRGPGAWPEPAGRAVSESGSPRSLAEGSASCLGLHDHGLGWGPRDQRVAGMPTRDRQGARWQCLGPSLGAGPLRGAWAAGRRPRRESRAQAGRGPRKQGRGPFDKEDGAKRVTPVFSQQL